MSSSWGGTLSPAPGLLPRGSGQGTTQSYGAGMLSCCTRSGRQHWASRLGCPRRAYSRFRVFKAASVSQSLCSRKYPGAMTGKFSQPLFILSKKGGDRSEPALRFRGCTQVQLPWCMHTSSRWRGCCSAPAWGLPQRCPRTPGTRRVLGPQHLRADPGSGVPRGKGGQPAL